MDGYGTCNFICVSVTAVTLITWTPDLAVEGETPAMLAARSSLPASTSSGREGFQKLDAISSNAFLLRSTATYYYDCGIIWSQMPLGTCQRSKTGGNLKHSRHSLDGKPAREVTVPVFHDGLNATHSSVDFHSALK